MLTYLRDIDLREMSETYSGTRAYLSIYMPVGNDAALPVFIQRRLRDLKRALPRDEWINLESLMEMVGSFIQADPIPGERGRIVFASKDRTWCATSARPKHAS